MSRPDSARIAVCDLSRLLDVAVKVERRANHAFDVRLDAGYTGSTASSTSARPDGPRTGGSAGQGKGGGLEGRCTRLCRAWGMTDRVILGAMGTWSRTLPDSLGFPVYGLCSDFAGSRTLGLWVDESGPVWRVPLDHEGGDGDVFITVLTIGKLSGRFSFNDTRSAALFDLVQLGMTDPPGTRAAGTSSRSKQRWGGLSLTSTRPSGSGRPSPSRELSDRVCFTGSATHGWQPWTSMTL